MKNPATKNSKERLIIFDCDGTLIDSESIASKIFPSVWATMGLELSEEYFLCNFVGVANDSEFVKSILARLPPNALEIANQKFEEELARSLKPTDGIAEVLNEIKHEMCVASNSSVPYLKKALLKTKLAHHFQDRIYSATHVANPKPAPDLFIFAAKSLGYKPR